MGILDLFKKKKDTEETTAPEAAATPVYNEPETEAEQPVAVSAIPEREEALAEEVPVQLPVADEVTAEELPLLPFEALMKDASLDVNLRFDFYRNLPQQKVFVITSPNTQVENGSVKQNTNVELATFPDGKIPFFTALPRIFEKQVIKEQVPYLEIAAGDLFQLTKGATLVLNPFSDFGKELVPEEIAQILDGSIFGDSIREVAVPRDTQVRVGQPAVQPVEMMEALSAKFSVRDDVNAAYIAVVDMPETNTPPRLLIAMSISGDRQTIFEEAGRTAQQFLKQGESVDIMELTPENGISAYFDDQLPFYNKASIL
ncbi:MAG: enhanced serine sensitivity protein SseB C-terminal domain-containing protein [Bacteroidia bacterium]